MHAPQVVSRWWSRFTGHCDDSRRERQLDKTLFNRFVALRARDPLFDERWTDDQPDIMMEHVDEIAQRRPIDQGDAAQIEKQRLFEPPRRVERALEIGHAGTIERAGDGQRDGARGLDIGPLYGALREFCSRCKRRIAVGAHGAPARSGAGHGDPASDEPGCGAEPHVRPLYGATRIMFSLEAPYSGRRARRACEERSGAWGPRERRAGVWGRAPR